MPGAPYEAHNRCTSRAVVAFAPLLNACSELNRALCGHCTSIKVRHQTRPIAGRDARSDGVIVVAHQIRPDGESSGRSNWTMGPVRRTYLCMQVGDMGLVHLHGIDLAWRHQRRGIRGGLAGLCYIVMARSCALTLRRRGKD